MVIGFWRWRETGESVFKFILIGGLKTEFTGEFGKNGFIKNEITIRITKSHGIDIDASKFNFGFGRSVTVDDDFVFANRGSNVDRVGFLKIKGRNRVGVKEK